MNRRPVILLTLLLCVPTGADAQRIVRDAWYDLKNGGLDVIHVWTRPFHGSTRDWAMFGAVAATAGLASIWDDDIDAWIALHQDGRLGDVTEPFRDPPLVHLGSGHHMMRLLAVVWGAGLIADNQTLRDTGMGCMATIQSNAVVRSIIYKSISRARPDTANGNQYDIALGGGGWHYHAFPGGHGANAHACATFIADRFDLDWFSLGLHAAAAGVSFGRMVDRRHWLSDALVGTAMGVAIGRTIAARSRNRSDERNAGTDDGAGASLRLLPGGGGAVVVLYTIPF